MDAVKFLKEERRMCEFFEEGCVKCPLRDNRCCAISGEASEELEKEVAIVEKWSKEHPRKTRQSVFLEQWPGARMRTEGVLSICPATISPAYRGDDGGCSDISKGCVVCCREFWMQEVE